MEQKTRLTPEQIQHLLDRFNLNVAEFTGGSTMCLARNDGRMLKVETVQKMMGLTESHGWTQDGKWVKVCI